MRVREDDEVEIRALAEQLLGVLRLRALGTIEHRPVARMVGEPA